MHVSFINLGKYEYHQMLRRNAMTCTASRLPSFQRRIQPALQEYICCISCPENWQLKWTSGSILTVSPWTNSTDHTLMITCSIISPKLARAILAITFIRCYISSFTSNHDLNKLYYSFDTSNNASMWNRFIMLWIACSSVRPFFFFKKKEVRRSVTTACRAITSTSDDMDPEMWKSF